MISKAALGISGFLASVGLSAALGGWCGRCSAAEPSKPEGTMRVEKTLHAEEAMVTSIAYTSAVKPHLVETLSLAGPRKGEASVRRSEDNGRTWVELPRRQAEEFLGRREERQGDRLIKREPAGLYLLADRNILVQFFWDQESRLGEQMSFGTEAASQEHLEMRTARIFYRFSTDEGRSWGEPRQLIQKGPGYDATHWAEPIRHGKNGCSLTGNTLPIRLGDGSLILPVYFYLLDESGSLIKWPDRFGDVIWPVCAAACFRGEWNAAAGDFDWTMSSPVTAPEYMSHGMDECEVAQADDGKLMMIIRGCSAARQSFSGVKFYAISRDGGLTWGPPVPLTYPDGIFVNSPASLGNLFRSTKNGKLYVIANMVPQVCRQSDPRYPLGIAEVDPKYFWVLPGTLAGIADREPHHPQGVRFSNWQRIEDRETGNPVLYMTEARWDSIIPDVPGTVSPHSYRYEVHVPQ